MALSLVIGLGSCGKREVVEKEREVLPMAAGMEGSGIGNLPGPVYAGRGDSAIHWQVWSKETLAAAETAGRLVFVVIALPQQPSFQEVLAALEADAATVKAIHENYVPILLDGDASREMGLLTADLCEEIDQPLKLPLFLWMTHEGNPVAWIPVANPAAGAVLHLFDHSHQMVTEKWRNDSTYMLENSRLDQENRRTRISQRRNVEVASENPGEDAVLAVRQLVNLYDPVSRTLDEAGGLFPAGSLELLATAAMLPGVREEVREPARETTRELLADLLPSAMFDPLDGGVFTARRGRSWGLPIFTKNCAMQGRIAVALIAAHQATGDKLALERALSMIDYAGEAYRLENGLFTLGLAPAQDAANWLWSVDEVEGVLSKEDAAWWMELSGMDVRGNVAFEDDPAREFFRQNTIAVGRSVLALAEESGDAEGFRKRFDSVTKRLLEKRNADIGEVKADATPHAGATFRMVSAYAAAYTATGDAVYKMQAVETLTAARAAFGNGPRLQAYPGEAPAAISAGRAFLYALALQAVLDVADITEDAAWVRWSDDLVATCTELFTTEGYLKECPDEAQVLDLPMTDLAMLFDDSTAGLFSMAEYRLAARGQPMTQSFSKLALPLPEFAQSFPMRFTDLIMPTILRHHAGVVASGEGTDEEMRDALRRMPLRLVGRRVAAEGDEIPEGGVLIETRDGASVPATSAEALKDALLRPGPDR